MQGVYARHVIPGISVCTRYAGKHYEVIEPVESLFDISAKRRLR